ncbi:hypothetical protein L6452_31026 [Arctium lappa]|uniref:Uncharacterized protein n=1 Tax=Arctium lappa TaxID=4217 RepID=A0ACB8ZKY4_ARCLA|nr:hypothetical protein L6452_31026 [Arctium lappa]
MIPLCGTECFFSFVLLLFLDWVTELVKWRSSRQENLGDYAKDFADFVYLQDARDSGDCNKIRVLMRFLTVLMCSKVVQPSSLVVVETLLSSAVIIVDDEKGNRSALQMIFSCFAMFTVGIGKALWFLSSVHCGCSSSLAYGVIRILTSFFVTMATVKFSKWLMFLPWEIKGWFGESFSTKSDANRCWMLLLCKCCDPDMITMAIGRPNCNPLISDWKFGLKSRVSCRIKYGMEYWMDLIDRWQYMIRYDLTYALLEIFVRFHTYCNNVMTFDLAGTKEIERVMVGIEVYLSIRRRVSERRERRVSDAGLSVFKDINKIDKVHVEHVSYTVLLVVNIFHIFFSVSLLERTASGSEAHIFFALV